MAGYLGNAPTAVPLSSADLLDGIITSAKIANGAIVGDDINSTFNLTGKTVTLPAGTGGKVLQVVSTTKTDTQSFSSSITRSDITGLNVTLTPASSSNKVLVRFMVTHWGNDSHCQIERSINGGSYSIISAPQSAGSRTLTHSGGSHRGVYELNTATMEVLDSPNTTSSIIYKITFNNGPVGGNTGYVNRTSSDEDDGNGERSISTITAMEIAV